MRIESLSISQQAILELIKNAIWHIPLETRIDVSAFDEVLLAATRHAIVPTLYPAVRANVDLLKLTPECMAKWRSGAIAAAISGERVMTGQNNALTLLRAAGIQAVIHKGAAVARFYPDLTMRSMGDVDILVSPDDYCDAINALVKSGYRKGSEEHPYHTVLFHAGITFEVHFAVSRIPEGEAGKRLEAVMAQAIDHAIQVDLKGNAFLTLSPLHQTIALLMHMQKHMTSGGIGLRQLCDWMMFVSSVSDAEWSEILPMLARVGLKKFAQIMTKTCQRYLGLSSKYSFWAQDIRDDLCQLAIEDVFRGGNVTNRENEQSHSSMFLEDIGHFSSPFHGKMRDIHVLLFRIDQRANSLYSSVYRICFFRPALWVMTGCRYLWNRNGNVDVWESRRIAGDRRKLYLSAEFFR